MRCHLFVVAAICTLSACASVDPQVMVYVGGMERDCSKVVNRNQIPTIPIGLKLSPTEAASALRGGCMAKFGYSLYADSTFYYFVNNDHLFLRNLDSELVKSVAVIVDGRTGQVVDKGGAQGLRYDLTPRSSGSPTAPADLRR